MNFTLSTVFKLVTLSDIRVPCWGLGGFISFDPSASVPRTLPKFIYVLSLLSPS